MNLIQEDYFCYIENAITQEEIKIIKEYWHNLPIGVNNKENVWDLGENITSIKREDKNVEVAGIPLNRVNFLTERLKDIFNLVMSEDFILEGPHYYIKYPTEGFHSTHRDDAPFGNFKRKKVVTLQISDSKDYVGGDLVIKGVKAPRAKGTAIIYDSNKFHEVTTVLEGTRFSITECAGMLINI